MERGDFDDLPGAGKPIADLGEQPRPELVDQEAGRAREHRRAAAQPRSCARRTPSSTTTLDELNVEADVRRQVEDFNERVIAARYRLPEGPPLVTMPRDVDDDGRGLARAACRRGCRSSARKAARPARRRAAPARWWRRAVRRPVNFPMECSASVGESRPVNCRVSDRSYRRRHHRCYVPPHAVPKRQGLLPPARRRRPEPLREIPARPSRAIHFFDPSNEKMAAKIPGMVGTVDVLLGNLEDAIKADNKVAAREGLVKIAQGHGLRSDPAVDPGQRPRQPVGARRPHHAGPRDRRQARRDHGPEGAGRRGHPLRRPAARPARGQGRASTGRSSCTRSSRPPAAWRTSRRSAAPARACRASPSARPTWPPTGG